MSQLVVTVARQRLLQGVVLVACATTVISATTLEIYNPLGKVHVETGVGKELQISGQGTDRRLVQKDIRIARAPGRIVVHCEPPDGEPINLRIQLPFGFLLDVTTTSGEIKVVGMIRRALLQTESGNLFLSAPWRTTRIRLNAAARPKQLKISPNLRFSQKRINVAAKKTIWRLRDELDDPLNAYGEFRVKADTPGKVELTDHAIPLNSRIKFPWQAPAVLREILRDSPAMSNFKNPKTKQLTTDSSGADKGILFRSDVRMVNLVLAASDETGQPVTDLKLQDFSVFEDGVPQEVAFSGSENIPFNLAILLDLSGSTSPDRASMREAAARLVQLARPGDQVALYTLAGGVFHVVSKLTDKLGELLKTIQKIPDVAGASPLYDAVVLAYAEDLRYHPGQRNGLIVISDGIDNQISHQQMPSNVNFKSLLKAAGQVDALIYPVFLRSAERFGRGWSHKARRKMQMLADASGGRLFPALSIVDLDPIFPLVGEELRSVYSIAYYPKNQVFRGEWRTVSTQVKRPGVKVRARKGYRAR